MAVKNVTVGEFSAKAHTMVGDVLAGDMVRVDCDEAGAFVMLEEPEYKIMRDSLELLIAINNAGFVPKEFLEQWEKQKQK